MTVPENSAPRLDVAGPEWFVPGVLGALGSELRAREAEERARAAEAEQERQRGEVEELEAELTRVRHENARHIELVRHLSEVLDRAQTMTMASYHEGGMSRAKVARLNNVLVAALLCDPCCEETDDESTDAGDMGAEDVGADDTDAPAN